MKKVSRIEYCASFEPLQSGMGQDGESKILFPTMKSLDSDKKAAKAGGLSGGKSRLLALFSQCKGRSAGKGVDRA